MKKSFFTILMLLAVTAFMYGQSPNGGPQKEVELRGEWYDDDIVTDPATGNTTIRVVCIVVVNTWCVKTTSPIGSPINPQTQNGPLAPPDHYTSIAINNPQNTVVVGDVFAHYQNAYQGDLNYWEHRFFISAE